MRLLRPSGFLVALVAAVAVAGSLTASPASASSLSSMCSSMAQGLAGGSYGGAPVDSGSSSPDPGSDVAAIGYCIAALVADSQADQAERSTWVQDVTQDVFSEFGGEFNFMLANTGYSADGNLQDPGIPYTESFSGPVFTLPIPFHGVADAGYTLWIFSGSGTFDNEGDTGWLNWGFGGLYTETTQTRSYACAQLGMCTHLDHIVTFNARTPSGTPLVLRSQQNAGYCLDDLESGTANGNETDLWPCNYTATGQQWKWVPNSMITGDSSDDTGMIVIDGKCLDDPDGSGTPGTKLELWDCNGGSNQMWWGDNSGRLGNVGGSDANGTSLCLTIPGDNIAAGQALELEDCGYAPGQYWQWYTEGAPGYMTMKSDATGLDLDSNAAGDVYADSSNGGEYQEWVQSYDSSAGGWKFMDNATGRCLDSNAAGDIYTNPCQTGNKYQAWNLSGGDDGGRMLIDVATNRALDGNSAGSMYTSNPYAAANGYQNWIAGT